MKDYTLTTNCSKNNMYIKKFKDNGDGTYYIEFADGTKFDNIVASEENLSKIEKAQEAQAKYALAHKNVYEKRKERAKVKTFLSGVAGAIGSTAITFLPVVHDNINDPIILATGIGIITVASIIPGAVKVKRENGKIKELNKIEYRDEHREILEDFENYENSLEGINNHTTEVLESSSNPFSILNIDDYSTEDLKTIVRNIQREEAYQFTYKK